MGTVRQELITLLTEAPMDLCDLSAALDIREVEVADHLAHVDRSLKARGCPLEVVPAYCRQCDFRFNKRGRFTRPGRCPRCRSNRIQGAIYRIRP